jgi:hypothetical protein
MKTVREKQGSRNIFLIFFFWGGGTTALTTYIPHKLCIQKYAESCTHHHCYVFLKKINILWPIFRTFFRGKFLGKKVHEKWLVGTRTRIFRSSKIGGIINFRSELSLKLVNAILAVFPLRLPATVFVTARSSSL